MVDEDYFKRYYKNKLKNNKRHCEICNIDVDYPNFHQHKRSKTHKILFIVKEELEKTLEDDEVVKMTLKNIVEKI